MSSSDHLPASSREDAPTPFAVTERRRPKPVPPSLAPVATPPRRLWLCIYLPALPIQALDRTGESQATAVFENVQGLRRVLQAGTKARAAGISPGLAVNAALALLPTLRLLERSPQRERRTLETLAVWAERFTSFVCIEMPDVLLLEIAGSLKLFGGFSALEQRIASGLHEHGFKALLSVAPTPLSSIWSARSDCPVRILDKAGLAGALGNLPIRCLGWPDSVNEQLSGMGITRVGDCLRLPREGFTRRFGASRLLELDRALGRLPDPRQPHRATERFCSECELAEEQTSADLLLNVCGELLIALERFLLTRQMSVQRVSFSFFHLRGPATHVTLGCAQASHDIDHWFELLRIKFDTLELPAPVIAIRLRGGQSQLLAAKADGLLLHNAGKRQVEPIAHLVERLGARIGGESVHGITTVAEHRPQYAWIATEPGQGTAVTDHGCEERSRRPLWMLAEPKPLPVKYGIPLYQGALRLVDRPERLETGWWDDHGIARDYYVAVNPVGIYVWVYRDRRSTGAWYLHGIFA